MSGSSNPAVGERAGGASPAEKKRRFAVASDFSDVVLEVCGTKFHVNKQQLARHSKFFHKKFYGEHKVDTSEPVKIFCFKEDFEELLELMYGYSNVNARNIRTIIHWASHYECEDLIKRCGDFLMEDTKITKAERFEWALRFKIDYLKKKMLAEITTIEELRSLLKMNDLESYSHEDTTTLLKMALELPRRGAAKPRKEEAHEPIQASMSRVQNNGQDKEAKRRIVPVIDIDGPEVNNAPSIRHLLNLHNNWRRED
ncbi:hypothetical protein CRE_08407 [Caenorhabditis remanei]|uniref:Uncharacterized protein n=1 Tax=Caenorhabditis remanei TaxID=31234 RepID=E3MPK6_CAERE|nr:hypothetical protein CRE_08407 [Caenorhabditis remanei]